MDKIERLDLLQGHPVNFNNLIIYQPNLNEINAIGYSNYARLTNLLTLSEGDLIFFFNKEKIKDGQTSPILYLYEQSLINPTFFLELRMAFFTYLKEETFLDSKNKGFKFLIKNTKILPNGKKVKTQEFFFLNQSNFYEFQKIICTINMMEEEEDDEIITDNLEMKKKFEEARKKLKLAKAKAKAEKAAKERDKGISFSDIVSSLCAYGIGYTLFNIWDLTIYQLYDQFKRCQMKEDYETGTQMLLAGVDSKKVDLQYWMKKITL